MESIDSEEFNIASIQIRVLAPVPAVTTFQDSTMGPFESNHLSIITLKDTEGNIGEAPVFSSYTHVLENCIFPILFHSRNVVYKDLYPQLYWSLRNEGFRGQASAVLGQLDMALHDMAARRRGKPLHEYLNAARNDAPMYGSGCGTNYSYIELDREINFFLGVGVDCIKMKVGKDRGTNMKKDIERVKFVRTLVGKDIMLAVDANQIWKVEEALRFIDAVSGENIAWFEEPVHSASLTEIEAVCEISTVAISYGESERSAKVFPALVNAGVRHLQPSPNSMGSVKEWMEVRDLAIQSGINFTSGGYSLYTASLMTTAPEKFKVEYLYTLMSVLEPYFSICPKLEKGRFVMPEIEGLPIRIDWDFWERRDKVVWKKSWTAENSPTYSPAVIV